MYTQSFSMTSGSFSTKTSDQKSGHMVYS